MSQSFFRRSAKHIFIFLNLAIVLLFIPGCFVKNFNPQAWWFLGLLSLSLPYLILLLVLFIIFWMVANPKWSLLSIIALAIGWHSVKNVIPIHFNGSFNMEKPVGHLRVMSWNIEQLNILVHKEHPEIKDKQLDLINLYKPDIACFQEMVGSENKKAINYLGDIMQTLHFQDSYYTYDKRFDFDNMHHFGVIIFSRYPIINRQTVINPPYDYNTTFQYIDILYNNDTVRVFNVHLQSLRFTNANREYLDHPKLESETDLGNSRSVVGKLKIGFRKRAFQADYIKAEIIKSPYPVILCGDFNDVPNSYAYEKIGEGLQNAFVSKGLGLGRTFSGIAPTLRIDNIWADMKFTVHQVTRVPKILSDHFPVIADMSIDK